MGAHAVSQVRTSFLALAVVAALGCADPVPTAVQPCPCADGFVCCGSGVCAQDQSSCVAATAALSAQVQGEWSGYMEGATFPSGSDKLALSFSAAPDGTLMGTVVLGEGTPPPPPTDGTAIWPDADAAPKQGPSLPGTIEGFVYTAHHIVWEARRLKFDLAMAEPLQPWCALQTSYPAGNDRYACVPLDPSGTTSFHGGPDNVCTGPTLPMPINCDVLDACLSDLTCTCAADGCRASEAPGTSFDIALRGEIGDGSMNGTNIRLTRL